MYLSKINVFPMLAIIFPMLIAFIVAEIFLLLVTVVAWLIKIKVCFQWHPHLNQRKTFLIAGMSILNAIFSAILIFFALREISDIFSAFGAEINMFTRVILEFGHLLWLVIIVPIIYVLFIVPQKIQLKYVWVWRLVFGILLFVVMTWGFFVLNTPIFDCCSSLL